MSVTHIASKPVIIDDRLIQRCGWCGEKLLDSKGTMAPTNPDGTAPVFPTWPDGALVQVDGNRSLVIEIEEPWELPADHCHHTQPPAGGRRRL